MPRTRARSKHAWTRTLTCHLAVCLVLGPMCQYSLAVTSKIHQIKTAGDMAKGDANNILIGSRGTIALGHPSQTLVEELEGIWSINCVAQCGATLYLGTSPNGHIYSYQAGKLERVYPPNEPRQREDPNEVLNEHVFAMASDLAGRAIAAVSGQEGKILRLAGGKVETLCTLPGDCYVFAISVDQTGALYMGTGPQGRIYRLDPDQDKDPILVHDCLDKNILSLAVAQDGLVYVGVDGRGLIYRIDPRRKAAGVLYDCSQPEVTGLVLWEGTGIQGPDLYALATSAKIAARGEGPRAIHEAMPGRPEPTQDSPEPGGRRPSSGRSLQVANTRGQPPREGPSGREGPPRRSERPDGASRLIRISPAGYVHEVASENAVFLCIASGQDELFIGTGNEARLLAVNPGKEEVSTFYQDRQASQITAVGAWGKDLYIGTANPARLIRLKEDYAAEGVYTSGLIDAEQPARWGKLQLEADIPEGCAVLVSCRSGNVEDANDQSFSAWTEPQEVAGPVQLTCPVGRFCQFRLVLKTHKPDRTPVIRQVMLSSTIPNLAPVVESVDINRLTNPPSRKGFYKVTYKARDINEDKLVYDIYIRRWGKAPWILLKEGHEEDSYELDGHTFEDGRYEIRVMATDQRSNTPATTLTGSRISDPFVIDNTGPAIKGHYIDRKGRMATVVLIVEDRFSVVQELAYTVDGGSEWKAAVPDDGVYDTTEEHFTIQLENLGDLQHILAVKTSDDLDNTTYRAFDIPGPDQR